MFSDSLDELEELAEDSEHVSTQHTDTKESFVPSDNVDTEESRFSERIA